MSYRVTMSLLFKSSLLAVAFTLLGAMRASAQDSVCAQVTLQLSQQAVVTRSAFSGSLVITNSSSSPVSQISVTLNILDAGQNNVNTLFGIPAPALTGLNAVNGAGMLAANSSGTVKYTIVPTQGAAATGPTNYFVGGTLSYVAGGNQVTLPLYPAPITVNPGPSLTVKYFLQHDVYGPNPFMPVSEPPQPAGLGLLIINSGMGAANNFTITSAQPQIVSNAKGLLISFQIIGAQVGAQPVQPSLTLDFGNIAAGATAEALFLLTASLQGEFISYNASFQQTDDFGNPQTSLIDNVEIHEMDHVVRIDVPSDDGLPDFLAIDSTNVEALPNNLYSSTGAILPVASGTTGSFASTPTAGVPVKLTATMAAGWAYLEINDPTKGTLPLTSVVRSDGRVIMVGPNAWTTQWTTYPPGQAPVTSELFHLLDENSTGSDTVSYTVTYGTQATNIQLSSEAFTAPEGPSSAIIAVQRLGDTAAAASVNFATSDGTAVAGTDYTTVKGMLSFAKGQTSKTLMIPILKNKGSAAAEPGKMFNVTLSDATGATLNTPATATVTIVSNAPMSFAEFAGEYGALFQAGTSSNGLNGSLRVNLLGSGRFTSSIRIGGQTYSLSGKFNDAGFYSGKIVVGKTLILVNLQLDLTGGTNQITGTLTEGAYAADLTADLASFNAKSNPAAPAGSYTVSFPHPADVTAPQGDGYGTVTVGATGNVRFGGALGDGTKVSQGSVVSNLGTWPLYLSLLAGKGYASGLLTFEPSSSSNDLDGAVTWLEPANPKAKLYPGGFVTSIAAVGSRYNVPPAGAQALYFPNPPNDGTVILDGGNLTSPLNNTVTLTANSKVIVTPASDKFQMKITLASGLFSGSFLETGNKIKLFNGVLLQKQNAAAGLFLGTSQSGYVELTPSF